MSDLKDTFAFLRPLLTRPNLLMGTGRECCDCWIVKDPSEFYVYGRVRADGTKPLSYRCKPCERARIYSRRLHG